MAKKKKPIRRLLTKVNDVPATHMELKAIKRQLSSVQISMDKKFQSIDERFDSVDKRFESIDKRFDSLSSQMEAGFNRLSADIHKVLVIVEEQNARNKVVMGSQGFVQYKLENLDARVTKVEKSLNEIK